VATSGWRNENTEKIAQHSTPKRGGWTDKNRTRKGKRKRKRKRTCCDGDGDEMNGIMAKRKMNKRDRNGNGWMDG